jgi:hypothetical protein
MTNLNEISLLPKLKINASLEDFKFWKIEFNAFVDLVVVGNKKDINVKLLKLLRYAIAGARITFDVSCDNFDEAFKAIEDQVNVSSKPPYPLTYFVESKWIDEDESILVYVEKLKCRAFFLSNFKSREELVKQHLLEQLRPEIRAIVCDDSIQVLVKKLSSLDRNEIRLSSLRVNAISNNHASVSSSSDKPFKLICFNCEVEGHTSRFCKKDKVKCLKCKHFGHNTKFCRSKNSSVVVSSVEQHSHSQF